jgi:hypothetical protein
MLEADLSHFRVSREIIKGEVKKFFVREESTYKSTVEIHLTVIDQDGKALWNGLASGEATRSLIPGGELLRGSFGCRGQHCELDAAGHRFSEGDVRARYRANYLAPCRSARCPEQMLRAGTWPIHPRGVT